MTVLPGERSMNDKCAALSRSTTRMSHTVHQPAAVSFMTQLREGRTPDAVYYDRKNETDEAA